MKTLTKELQTQITPKEAFSILENGNKRFVENLKAQRNLKEQVLETSKGQYPFAVIHSCIDSRVPVELVFDQGIGDIFSSRVAGNIINEDVLGSMEYACKVAGSKIIVVLGHTKCGAVTSACQHIEMGNISTLLHKISPAVTTIASQTEKLEDEQIEQVAVQNVKNSIQQIRQKSPILAKMEDNNEIEIVGGIYDVATGIVAFCEQ